MAENPTVCAQVASLAPPQLELAPQFLCYMMMVVVMTLMKANVSNVEGKQVRGRGGIWYPDFRNPSFTFTKEEF